MELDSYKTVQANSEAIFKDRNSKFLAFAYPVSSEIEVQTIIKKLKKIYFDARHHCFAYRIGPQMLLFRASDDGEPSNSAGIPILNQIRSSELTNILIVVVRYFGGTLLGVPGLINAYKSAATEVIKNSIIIKCTVNKNYNLNFGFENLNNVMKIIKDSKFEIIEQKFDLNCYINLNVPLKESSIFENKISKIEGLNLHLSPL